MCVGWGVGGLTGKEYEGTFYISMGVWVMKVWGVIQNGADVHPRFTHLMMCKIPIKNG